MAEPEVIGANSETLVLGSTPADTAVAIAPAAGGAVVASMGPAAPADVRPKRLFLKLENIRGNSPAGGLKAYVNLPPEAEGDLPQDRVAGSAALFGLSATSRADGGHGGNGISLVFDITDLARRLIADGDFDPEHLRVKVVAAHEGGDEDPVTVDRVSVLRE